MTMKTEYRACVTIGALIAASLALSGCLGPTYGTDKTATEQFVDDLGNIASIGLPERAPSIEYKPRPAIVKPTGETPVCRLRSKTLPKTIRHGSNHRRKHARVWWPKLMPIQATSRFQIAPGQA
jgi:hypothetical protein